MKSNCIIMFFNSLHLITCITFANHPCVVKICGVPKNSSRHFVSRSKCYLNDSSLDRGATSQAESKGTCLRKHLPEDCIKKILAVELYFFARICRDCCVKPNGLSHTLQVLCTDLPVENDTRDG